MKLTLASKSKLGSISSYFILQEKIITLALLFLSIQKYSLANTFIQEYSNYFFLYLFQYYVFLGLCC